MNIEDEPDAVEKGGKQGKSIRRKGLGGGVGTCSEIEQLDYIADMVQALKAIAAQAHCRTLTNLLDLAHREAVQRRRAGGRG
jgi:hypothetical protein